MTPDRSNIILVVVNMDPYTTHEARLTIPIDEFGIGAQDTYQLHELLQDYRHQVVGGEYKIRLDPKQEPAAIFALRKRVRRENDFDYFQ